MAMIIVDIDGQVMMQEETVTIGEPLDPQAKPLELNCSYFF